MTSAGPANTSSKPRKPSRPLRRFVRWGLLQHVFWSVGNALTAGPLLLYLAMDLGAKGAALSWILAAPQLAGALRMATPRLAALLRGEKPAALLLFSLAYVLLLGQAWAAWTADSAWSLGIAGVVVVVCAHQLCEFMGQSALWGCIGYSVPAPLRGRYLAWRNSLGLAVSMPTMLAAGYFVDQWKQHQPDSPLGGYAITVLCGCASFACSVVCLAFLPAPLASSSRSDASAGGDLQPPTYGNFFRIAGSDASCYMGPWHHSPMASPKQPRISIPSSGLAFPRKLQWHCVALCWEDKRPLAPSWVG